MKRVLCLMISLLLLWSCAAAEWTCPYPSCGRTWDDQETICNECGWEAPLHGLHVTMAGDNSLRLQWYGYMAYAVDLYYRTEGAGGWTLCGTTDRLSLHVDGLTKGTAYEFQLLDWNNNSLTVIGSTTANGVPLSSLTALYDESVARVAELEADVAARDATIAAQQTTIDEQAASLTAAQATIDEQAATIAERDTTIAAQQTTIDEQAATIAERDTTIAAQQATIDEQAAALAATPTPSPTPAPTPTPKPVAVGDYITYGHYPQTAQGTDNTPIEWLVLDVQGNKALVISRYGLDAHRFDASTYQGWDKSEIRTWLNSTFLNRAFTAEEQRSIITTTVKTGNNAEWVAFCKANGYSYDNVSGGADTQDKVFLLSLEEAMAYGGYSTLADFYYKGTDKLKAIPTKYAVAQGAYQSDSNKLDGTGCCWWWLRSPGYFGSSASRVRSGGSLYYDYSVNFTSGAIRPAFFLNLDSATIY